MANQPKKYKKFVATAATATLVASAIVPVASAASFSDVSFDNSHKTAIDALVEQGIISGYQDGTFKPNAELTRGHVVKMLGRWVESLGATAPTDYATKARFNDVAVDGNDQELVKYAALLKDKGVFGVGTDTLNASGKITRENMALVLDRAYEAIFGTSLIDVAKTEGKPGTVSDLATAKTEAQPAIQALKDLGITVPANFQPKDSVTRAQFATFLYRTMAVEQGNVGLNIVQVTALNDANSFLQIEFSQPVYNLETSDILIKDAKTDATYGVKDVKVSKDGRTATVELYAHDDADKDDPVLEYVTDYTVSVNVESEVITATFNRAYSEEVRVTDVNYDDRKITVSGDSTTTLEVPESVEMDFEEVKGRTMQVWYNQDDEVVRYVLDDKETVIYAPIQLDKNDRIVTLNDDKKYDISDKKKNNKEVFKFFLNDEEEDYVEYREDNIVKEKDPETDFAKVVLGSNGEVEYISAYNFQGFAVVESIDEDGEEIVGVTGTQSISDAADFFIVKDGKRIDYTDLEKGDVVLYNDKAYNGDGYALVYNKSVTGTVDSVYEDAIEIDGEEYNYIRDEYYMGNMSNALYLNEDGEYETLSTDDAEDLEGTEITAYFDAKGDLLFIANEVVASVKDVAVLTEDVEWDKSFNKYALQLEALGSDGKEKLYNLQLTSLDKITLNDTEYDIDDSSDRDSDEYKPEISNDNIVLTSGNGKVVTIPLSQLDKGSLVQFGLDKNDDVEELILFTNDKSAKEAYSTLSENLEDGDKYAKTEAGSKKLNSNTVVFDVTDGYDAKDINITTWGEYKGSLIEKARVLYDDDNEVVAVVIEETGSDDNVYEEAVVTAVSKNTDGEVVRITAYVDGKEQTIKVDEIKSNVRKGDVVIFTFDEGNTDLVKDIDTDSRIIEGLVVDTVDLGKREVTFKNYKPGTAFKLVSNGLVLDGYNNDDISTESLSELRGEENVTLVLDETTGTFAKFFVMEPGKGSTDTTAPDKVSNVKFEDTDNTEGKIGGTVTFTASPSTDVEKYIVNIGGKEFTSTTASVAIPAGTDFVAEGTVVAVDAAGNQSDKVDFTIVDKKAPENNDDLTAADLETAGALSIKNSAVTDKLKNVLIDSTKLDAELQGKTLVLVIDGTEVEFVANRFKPTQLEANNLEFTEDEIRAAEILVK